MTGESLTGVFEDLRDRIISMPAPSGGARRIVWAGSSHSVGVARDHLGHLEVFIVGEPLVAAVGVVRDALEYDTWARENGESLKANRLVLPVAPHFDSVAAFICAELVENGVEDSPQEAFLRSERVIALAIARGGISNQALVGLVGELVLLAALLKNATLADRESILDAWKGAGPSSRDFQFGHVGIEVKTTAKTDSSHHLQGLHQVTLGTSVDGVPESALFLLSLGLKWLPLDAQAGRTLPSLVDEVLGYLPIGPAGSRFLELVHAYGGDGPIGYSHEEDRGKALYRRPFMLIFERLYDMADPGILLPDLEALAPYRHMDADSLSFRVELPAQVRGDLNPVVGLRAIVEAIRTAGSK